VMRFSRLCGTPSRSPHKVSRSRARSRAAGSARGPTFGKPRPLTARRCLRASRPMPRRRARVARSP
jgi:hypothetical protein